MRRGRGYFLDLEDEDDVGPGLGQVSLREGITMRVFAGEQRLFREEMEVTMGKTSGGWSRRGELNSRPADYESAALPLSYVGSQSGYREERVKT